MVVLIKFTVGAWLVAVAVVTVTVLIEGRLEK